MCHVTYIRIMVLFIYIYVYKHIYSNLYIIFIYINSIYNTKRIVSLSMLITWCPDLVPSRRSISGERHRYSLADSEQGFL